MLFNIYPNRFVFYIVDYECKNDLVEFAQTIANTLESLLSMERVSGGIGIVEVGQDNGLSLDLMLRHLLVASERAISAFEKDFNICIYDEKLEALVNRERDIIDALNTIAADNNINENLFLQYQPILNLKTGAICGFEALARLRAEKLGLVSPVEFIPIAEKTKLILPIGEIVIVTAFRFLNRLRKHGYDNIYVSINISVIQLLNPDFPKRLFELISEMQVNPKNIGIEITESVFASDYKRINNIIAKFKKAGMNIAIDDFGTGYSSLVRERELTVDNLKIDKYFIGKLPETDINNDITCDIISMSHKLGHCTIAEGVEHEYQLYHLKKHGCDKVQGFLISKPLDEEDAIEFLRKYPEKAGEIGLLTNA